MKRFILLALILLFSFSALCEAPLPADSILSIDLDGDGTEESVSWSRIPDDFDEHLVLTVTTPSGETVTYTTGINGEQAVYVTDLDGDGMQELLLTGDVMSDDYYTWCLHYANGAFHEVLFPDVERGDNNTDRYYKYGYGRITTLEGNRITLTGSQDVLGTWFASRTFALTPWERFEFDDEGLWVRHPGDEKDLEDLWAYAALTVKKALAYVDDQGNAGLLQPGDRILIYASDKETSAWFTTQDGVSGVLSIVPDYERGWGRMVDGIPEEECFEYMPYAD